MTEFCLTRKEYLSIAAFLKRESGLDLGQPNDKEYLLRSRLEPLAQTILQLEDLKSLVKQLEVSNDQMVRDLVVEAMTTNETFFFRDPNTFEFFRKEYLPSWYKQNPGKKLKIWSAASSAGQELYSLAMILHELKETSCPLIEWEMIGTDLSSEMIERCRRASYNRFEVERGLSKERLEKYFDPVGTEFVFKQKFRENIHFLKMNLLHPHGLRSDYDIILCRNVLIYFDSVQKEETLAGIAQRLHATGIFVLGGTESLLGLETPFQRFSRAVPIFSRKDDESC